jgi:hypothetical protein
MMRRRLLRGDWLILAVLLLALGAGVTTIVSCGSGGGGSSDGGLCEQCGDDPDGPCQSSVEVEPGPNTPTCDDNGDPPCTVTLHCFRKRDSAQRRCFPEHDLSFRCDGEPADRSTPVPTATPTTTPSPITQTVTFAVNGPLGLASFILHSTYPTAKGDYVGSSTSVSCTTNAGAGSSLFKSDDDNGLLQLQVQSVLGLPLPTTVTCTFADVQGQTLSADDLVPGVTIDPGTITVQISVS